MKKTFCCLLTFAVLLITSQGYAQHQEPATKCIPEPPFDYGDLTADDCVYSFSAKNFATSATNFRERFKYRNENGILKRPEALVSINELKTKFSEIQTKMNYHPDKGDIAGLVMHFAMDGDKLFVIFQSTVLHVIKKTNKYTWELGTDYYKPDAQGIFQPVPQDAFIRYTTAYTGPNSEIYIKHTKRRFGHKFYKSKKKFFGDVTHCTMPLQQIFKMYNDNGGDCDKAGEKGLVRFSIEATEYKRSKGNYKLHVVAFYKNDKHNSPSINASESFQDLGADFSQMSPPNNNYLVFPPISQQKITQKNLVEKVHD